MKQRKKGNKAIAKFGENLEAMNFVFNTLKNFEKVNAKMVNVVSPIKLDPKMVDTLVEDINNYESKS